MDGQPNRTRQLHVAHALGTLQVGPPNEVGGEQGKAAQAVSSTTLRNSHTLDMISVHGHCSACPPARPAPLVLALPTCRDKNGWLKAHDPGKVREGGLMEAPDP